LVGFENLIVTLVILNLSPVSPKGEKPFALETQKPHHTEKKTPKYPLHLERVYRLWKMIESMY
jgi:hypothetical protein